MSDSQPVAPIAAADGAKFNPAVPADVGFTPIADYAFVSDCHTGALVGPDGAIDWLCVPRFDSASVFTALLDRSAGQFRVGPYGVYVPVARRYLPGTNVLETTWKTRSGWLVVRDALAIGPWRDGADAGPQTRPPTDQASQQTLIRVVECVQGQVELEVVCEPMFDYAREPGVWELTADEHGGVAHVRGPHGPDAQEQEVRLASDLRLGVESSRVRARHTLSEGDRCFAALGLGRRREHRPHGPGGRGVDVQHLPLLAHVAGRRRVPRPPMVWPPAALGAGAEGPHLRADRRAGRGPDDIAARDTGWRAQLGLPLHMDARRHVHPLRAPRARARLGGRRLHAVRRRPRPQRGRLAADHVRHRRRARPGGVDARPPARLRPLAAGADRQRRLQPAPERRLRGGRRFDLPAHQAAQSHAARPVAAGGGAGPMRVADLARTPTRASGRRAANRSTT